MMASRPAEAGSGAVIIIPTYNESENIRTAVADVLLAVPAAHVLIVDDQSPDGTGDIAESLRAADERVHVLHRTTRTGLAGAYLQGFAWALDHGYTVVGEFDADGSHPATALPSMFAALETPPDAWLVIGSRWVRGGTVENWPRSREVLSRGGNAYARAMLGLRVHDVTAGFRLYRAHALRSISLADVSARGYGFQVDLTTRVRDAGGGIVEVPIRFREREHGSSKMSRAIVIEAMALVTVAGVERALGRIGGRARRTDLGPVSAQPAGAASHDGAASQDIEERP